MTLSTPCAVDRTGVTLYRWPMRSVFVPLERVDRFDVLLSSQTRSDPGGHVERLVLLTRDGKTMPVQAVAIERLSGWHRLSLATVPST